MPKHPKHTTNTPKHPPKTTQKQGFCKLALQYGCPLVPYFAFGESDLYFTFNHGKEFQLWLASTYKIAFPPCWCVFGRSGRLVGWVVGWGD
jgi:hypothetical protein